MAGRCRRCAGAAVPTDPAAIDSQAATTRHAEHCMIKKKKKKSHAGKQGGRGPHPPTAGPLQLSLKYLLSHHHQTTGMSVSDRLLGEQHVPSCPSVHTAHKCQHLDCIRLNPPPPPSSPQGKTNIYLNYNNKQCGKTSL